MTLTEILASYGMAEEEFVAELSRDLRAAPNSSATRLTEDEDSLLKKRSGITSRVDDDASVRKATLQSSSSNLAEQTRESLSVEQAAKLLMVDGSRVRHRVRDRALYAFKIGGALRLPTWQFHRHDALPGLRTLLAALPADLHPLEVAGFMTGPDADLAVDDEPTSPRDWLLGGGASDHRNLPSLDH
ncbi:MAG: hypothetical protein ACR2LX_15230 [Jatrophihabitans sp.]